MSPVQVLGSAVLVAVVALLDVPARAQVPIDSRCHRAVLSGLTRFKKNYLRLQARCLNADNDNEAFDAGPCPAPIAEKLQKLRDRTVAAVARRCTKADLLAAGFAADCEYATPGAVAEALCFGLPVVDDPNDPTRFPGDVAKCLMCWKEASLARFTALVYASHAVEICGGSLDPTSPVCADLGCTTPLPDQHDLTNTDTRSCQKNVGKQAIKLFIYREKYLERCAIKGISKTDCLALYGARLADAAADAAATVDAKCGNHVPDPNATFCCRCGAGNACLVHSGRQACADDPAGCEVVEGKECSAGSCAPLPGPDKHLTWWGACPGDASCSTAVATLDDLLDCTFSGADEIVDALVCMQVQQPSACSPSGAFLDDPGR